MHASAHLRLERLRLVVLLLRAALAVDEADGRVGSDGEALGQLIDRTAVLQKIGSERRRSVPNTTR